MPRRRHTNYLHQPQLCGGKRRYPTKQQAERVCEEQELLNPGLQLQVYHCSLASCGGWHLTRRQPNMLQ